MLYQDENLSKASFASLSVSRIAPALKTPYKKDLCLAQKLVASLGVLSMCIC